MVPSLTTRRSALSLSSAAGAGVSGGQSLADELVSAAEAGGGAGGARSLMEEFGLDLDVGPEEDEDKEGDGGVVSFGGQLGSPSSSSYGHDPQFANPNDFEPDPFSTSHEFDDGADHFDHFGNEVDEFDEGNGHPIGMSLGDEFGIEPNGLPRDEFHLAPGLEEEQDLQTPTRSRMRTGTASTSNRSQASRSLGLGMAPSHPLPSSSRSSSPSTNHRRTSSSSSATHNLNDDSDSSESPPPQRLFSSSNVSSSASSAHQPSTPSLEELVALPPTFLPLLAQDDRWFEIEQKVVGLVKRMEDVGREREGWGRDLGAMDREVARLISEGVRFDPEGEHGEAVENPGLGVGMRGPMGALVEDESDDEGGGEEEEVDLNRSIDSDDDEDDHSGTARIKLNGQSPYTPRRSTQARARSRPANPFSPSPAYAAHPPRSPSSTFQPTLSFPAGPPSDLPLLLSTLSTQTSSLLETLSSLHDASQITLSSAADAGRRLRAVRQQFAVMKGEEEGVERARKALEEETGEGRGRGETVRREMEGFRSAMEEFEERTKSVREEHQRFLVGVV